MEKIKSQTDVAKAVGISQRLISAIESGDRSGREYMDQIAEYLREPPSKIFPHYDFYTFEEAAELMGVSSSVISARVDTQKVLPVEEFGGTRLIPKSALEGVQLRLRPAKSKRARLRDLLHANPDGLTSGQLVMEFAPFENDEAQKRASQTVQQLLSRFNEFEKVGHDAESGLLLWTVRGE